MEPARFSVVCVLLLFSVMCSISDGYRDLASDAEDATGAFFTNLRTDIPIKNYREGSESSAAALTFFLGGLVTDPRITPHCEDFCNGQRLVSNDCKGQLRSKCKVAFPIEGGTVTLRGRHMCDGGFEHSRSSGQGYLEAIAVCNGSLERHTDVEVKSGKNQLHFALTLNCGVVYDFHAKLSNDPYFDMDIEATCRGAQLAFVGMDPPALSSESLRMGDLVRIFTALLLSFPHQVANQIWSGDLQEHSHLFNNREVTCNGVKINPTETCQGLYNSTFYAGRASLGQSCVGELQPLLETQNGYLWTMSTCRGMETLKASLVSGLLSIDLLDTCTTEEFLEVKALNHRGLLLKRHTHCIGNATSSTHFKRARSVEPPGLRVSE